MYNQKLDKRTKYSCTIYSMLNIIKYDYGIEVKDDLIYKIVSYMEYTGVLLPRGAYFSVIYPAMCKLIKLKTGLNLKVKKSSISRGLDDKSMWGLGAKKLSSLSIELALDDGWITMNDMKTIAKSDKGGGHNHCIKQSNKNASWTLVESWGGISYKTSLKALMEGVLLGIYYDTARTLVPADTKTEKIQAKCVAIAKKKGRYVTYEELKKMLK